MKIEWKKIDTIPEDWLDGRKILVFDLARMSPAIMVYSLGDWLYNSEGITPDCCTITHYAADVDFCPADLSQDIIDDYSALGTVAARMWANALRFSKRNANLDDYPDLKPRPAKLWVAIKKMAKNTGEIKVYKKTVASAWETVFNEDHSHTKVSADLTALINAGYLKKREPEYDWRMMAPTTYILLK